MCLRPGRNRRSRSSARGAKSIADRVQTTGGFGGGGGGGRFGPKGHDYQRDDDGHTPCDEQKVDSMLVSLEPFSAVQTAEPRSDLL